MIKKIVHFALYQPLFMLVGLALLIGIGFTAFNQLPIEAFPDVTDNQVTVITLFPGRAPEEVEKQITIPLEIALAGIPNAIRLFSHTQFGLSYIVVTFNDKPSLFLARQLVQERLRGAANTLPTGVDPDLAPPATPTGEIFRYRLEGALPPKELRTLQDWVVARQILQVPGIADVVSLGGPIKQYEVQPDLAKLRDYKLTVGQLFTALSRGNANTGGGAVTQGKQQYLIRSIGLLESSADIGNIVVAENKGTPVLVKDIAEIKESSPPEQGFMGYNDLDDQVTGIVLLRKDENPTMVINALKTKIAALNQNGLPKGIKIVSFYDRSWLISKTLETVFSNLLEGALLVFAVMYLFLANIRAAGMVALVIPLALLGTFIGLTIVGIPANLLSLGAMDFGIIVDGAVIVIENIFRQLSGNVPANQRLKTIQDAAVEVGRPTVFSMIIIIVAHLPIFTMQRHEGKIFAPMAYSVVAALITSLILALTLIPFLSRYTLNNVQEHHENWLTRRFIGWYQPALSWALQHTKIVMFVAISGLISALSIMPLLGTEFLPELNEGSLWVSGSFANSISPNEVRSELRKMREIIKDFQEVNFVVSKAGRPDDGTDPKYINMFEFLVDLKPEAQWRTGLTKGKLISEMEQKLGQIPGIETSFSQPVRDNILESISQIKGQIVIKIFGEDLSLLENIAHQFQSAVANVQGVARAFIDREGDLPQFMIDIDREKAARYGLNIADVHDIIETTLAGKAATDLWEGQKHFSVVVRLPEQQRILPNIPNILIPTPSGAQIALSEIAHFKTGQGPLNIARESGRRLAALGVFIRDRDMGSIVADMKKQTANIKLPVGYSVEWSGEFENQERAMQRLLIVVPISILLIFLLLFDAFKSFRQAFLIISNIPFALIGGIWVLFLSGTPLSVSAAIGFIALFGQAVLNGVVMVNYFNQLLQEGKTVGEAVLQGSVVRLRTVLMTALLAMFGLFPMALSHGIGSETQRPLALVVIGGLLTATLLTLFVLPVLYASFIKETVEEIIE